MIRPLFLAAFALSIAGALSTSWAQQPDKVPVVGVLTGASTPDDPFFEVLKKGLRDLGHAEGRSMRIEFRTAQGHPDRLPGLAKALVQLKPDVIVATTPLAAQALLLSTSTIPVVVVMFDPAASGLVTNLAHPGGIVTGPSSMTGELYSKRLQLLKETIPRLSRVAVLWNPDTPLGKVQTKMVEDLTEAARLLSIELKFVVARTPEEFDPAFSAIGRTQAQALYLHENPLYYVHKTALASLATKGHGYRASRWRGSMLTEVG